MKLLWEHFKEIALPLPLPEPGGHLSQIISVKESGGVRSCGEGLKTVALDSPLLTPSSSSQSRAPGISVPDKHIPPATFQIDLSPEIEG